MDITDERLREMEDEMSRFEQEILNTRAAEAAAAAAAARRNQDRNAGDDGHRRIIGSNTYRDTEERISARADHYAYEDDDDGETHSGNAQMMLPPPPPPMEMIGPRVPYGADRMHFGGRPPPPPPPNFMPPQLRHRPPPPRMPFPPRNMMGGMPGPPRMHGPPRMDDHNGGGPYQSGMLPPPPPPPQHLLAHQQGPHGDYMQPPMHYDANMGPRPGMPPRGPPPRFAYQAQHMHSAGMLQTVPQDRPVVQPPVLIEQPKIVYSAPPVRNVIAAPEKPKGKKEKTVKEAGGSGSASATSQAVEGSGGAKLKVPRAVEISQSKVSKPTDVAPGIELNVPVEEIVAEKMRASTSTAPPMELSKEMLALIEGTKKEIKEKKEKKKKFVRMAAGTTWEDPTLGEWEQDDYRLFCGDLGNEVTEDTLARAFSKYPSFKKARVVRNKRTNKTKGFGFVSFKDPTDFVKAIREMNGKYVGNRPIKLRKSTWKDRQIDVVKKKDREKKKLGFR